MNKIKELISNGWTTLKSLLKLEWINFKNWRSWTSLRAAASGGALLALAEYAYFTEV